MATEAVTLKPEFMYTTAQTKRYYKELIKIEKESDLTPDNVVATAAHPKNPLHDYFEWDDIKAANNHRLHQARQLINHYKYAKQAGPRRRGTPVFWNVAVAPDEEEEEEDGMRRVYRSVKSMEKDPEFIAQMIDEAKKDLRAFMNRYKRWGGTYFKEAFQGITGCLKELKRKGH
jgi:hypothetical protein